ncbi:MAG: glycine cleavage system aminomethyltransferase GcvT, partial [Planctomycetes bacterium]|nr:glycine cleavage system aminomethyltransferase GcvT [Planctomycetota bacterium]
DHDLKKNFIGSDALKKIAKAGIKRTLVGLDVQDKRIARQGMKVMHKGKAVGAIASGTKSPTLDKIIATAHVPVEVAKNAGTVDVELREGVLAAAKVVPTTFYTRKK